SIVLYGQSKAQANCKSADIELSYTCFIGKPLIEIVQRIKLDTSRMRIIEEPPAVIKGIGVTIGDSCIVRIYTGGPLLTDSAGNKRFAHKSDFELIKQKKVIGITWAVFKDNNILRRGSAGDVVWYWGD